MLLINSAKEINWLASFQVRSPTGKHIDVSQYIQQVNIPSISLMPLDTTAPRGITKFYGTQPQYGSFDVQFLMDENWEIYTLLLSFLFNTSRSSKPNEVFGSVTIIAVDSYQTPKFRIEFDNLVLSSITDIQLQTSNTNQPLIVDCQFDFSMIKFRKISTAGDLGIGTGISTNGYYLEDGSWTGVDSSLIRNKYLTYEGKLINSGGAAVHWSVDLLEQDNYTVFIPKNTVKFVEGLTEIEIACGVVVTISNVHKNNELFSRTVTVLKGGVKVLTNNFILESCADINTFNKTYSSVDGVIIEFTYVLDPAGYLISFNIHDQFNPNMISGTEYIQSSVIAGCVK
jgi:hypothetical protein